MSDAVVHAAARDRMTVAVRTKAACPAFAIAATEEVDCERWQQELPAVLAATRPSVVVIANRSPWHVGDLDHQDDDLPAAQLQTADRRAEWRAAMETTLRTITSTGARVVVVGTAPTYPWAPSPSLLRPEGRQVTYSRREVDAQRGPVIGDEQEVAGRVDGVTYYDPIGDLCGDRCSNVADGEPVYNDEDHLNSAGALRLTAGLERAIDTTATRPR